jgi:hypothetical protein
MAMLRYALAMYIESVPNRNSPPAILLRESYRDGKSVRKRTLLNLSNWSPEHVEGLRGVLKGGVVVPAGQEALTVQRSLPHGHVAAVLGMARAIGLDRLLGPKNSRGPNRPRDLVLAMIVSRNHRSGVQAGDRQGARSGHGGFESRRRTRLGRCRRG